MAEEMQDEPMTAQPAAPAQFERQPQEGETVKVESLNVNSRSVNTLIKIVEKKDERDVVSKLNGETHKVAEFLVGDETGCVIMSLWDDAIGKVEIGKSFFIEKARVTVFQNSLRLNPGKYGIITPATEDVTVKMENNVSEKHVERPRRFGGGRGFGGGGRGFGGGGRGFGGDRGFGGGRGFGRRERF